MRNEALETSGYSQFFIQTASNFLNASDLIMQNLCTLITQISSFISSTNNDINLYKDNFKLNDIIQYTCYYSTVECLKSSIKICLSNIELLNTEINYNKRKKKSNQDEFVFTPMDSPLNLNDCVYDMLISIQDDYYDEKYKGLYEFDNPDEKIENVNDINISVETQFNYIQLIARCLSKAYYCFRLLEEFCEFPF